MPPLRKTDKSGWCQNISHRWEHLPVHPPPSTVDDLDSVTVLKAIRRSAADHAQGERRPKRLLLMRPGPKAFIALLFTAALTGCDDPCSSDLVASSPAPDGVVARLEKKNCGATVAYVYEVKAVDRDGKSHLVLRFDDGHNINWPRDDKALLDMHWVAGPQLELDLHVPVRVFNQKSELKGVPVRYRFAPGTSGI